MARTVVTRTVIRPNPAGLAALHRYIGQIHDGVVSDVYEDAQRAAPVRTGELWLSMNIRHVLRSPRRFISRVVVGTDHWAPMEYGARAHDIRPKPPKQALFWPGAPHPVTVVHHPGNAPQPFMRPALYQRRSLAKYKLWYLIGARPFHRP